MAIHKRALKLYRRVPLQLLFTYCTCLLKLISCYVAESVRYQVEFAIIHCHTRTQLNKNTSTRQNLGKRELGADDNSELSVGRRFNDCYRINFFRQVLNGWSPTEYLHWFEYIGRLVLSGSETMSAYTFP